MKEVSFARRCEKVVVVMPTFDFLFRQAMQALCISVRFDLPPEGLCVFWVCFDVLSCMLLLLLVAARRGCPCHKSYESSLIIDAPLEAKGINNPGISICLSLDTRSASWGALGNG